MWDVDVEEVLDEEREMKQLAILEKFKMDGWEILDTRWLGEALRKGSYFIPNHPAESE